MTTLAEPQYFAGDTKRFRSYDDELAQGITKDGVVWDLSSATYVNFQLMKVSDETLAIDAAATAEDAANGVFYYDATLPTPAESGDEYEVRWKASKGGVVQTFTWGVISIRTQGTTA